MIIEDFRTRFTEFRTASDPLIQSAIDEATGRVAPDIFGKKTENAIAYLAAHIIAMSPFGRSQRLVNDKGTTIYWGQFDAIRKEVVPRMIVI